MLVRSSLTAPERETVITFSDEDDTATVHKHQRRIITKLGNNPAAEEIDDISFDGLPPQPGCFEGFRRRREYLQPHGSTVAECPEVRIPAFDRDAAALATTDRPIDHHDLIARVKKFFGDHSVLVPRLQPSFRVPQKPGWP